MWSYLIKKTARAAEKYCTNCGKKITAAEYLSGKCSKCGADIIPVEVFLEDDFFMEGLF
jgi:Zn finger protein HypA/HybF involved in hydrogenase expression